MAGRKLFDVIAPVFGLYFDFQRRMYKDALRTVQDRISLKGYESILDVGCGTGAFADVLLARGFQVTGLDASPKMLRVARRKVMHPEARFVLGDGKQLPFADASFDIVLAAYVLHGMPPGERRKLYGEMRRVARHLVIVHDYNQKRSWNTDLAEWAERGDYFRFIRVAEEEMREQFPRFQVIPAGETANWYLGQVSGETPESG